LESEGYNLTQNFSKSFNVRKGQKYNFDMNLQAVNTNAFGQIEKLVFSFVPDQNTNSIPDSWEMVNF
jgi:hypothetical protein